MAITRIITPAVTDDSVTLAKMASGTDGNIISYDASGNPVAVATGNDGQVLTSAGAGAPPVFETLPVGGITMADQWRTNTNRSSFSTGVINQHWERVDTDSYGSIGSAMTESSGVFTFPATGRYLVMGQVSIIVGDNRDYSGAGIEVTTNNSSYNYASDTFQWGQDGKYISVNMSCLINVSDTSNIKVRLFFENESGNDVILGNTSETRTGITFIRMGDS